MHILTYYIQFDVSPYTLTSKWIVMTIMDVCFHNNESTPTDISTLLTTLSSLGITISISTILNYSSYFGLTKSNYFCLALHWAFYSIINFGGWISRLLSRVLLSGDVYLALVSLVNIHKNLISVFMFRLLRYYI